MVQVRCIVIGCAGTLDTRLPFSRRGQSLARCIFLPAMENIKELALSVQYVLIFIVWINDTLREQER